MKLIFLFLSTITFLIVSAQNNDLFDINRHLQKINKEKKFELIPYSVSQDTIKYFSSSLKDRNIIISLPQDNMPCVKADMKLHNQMPNAGKDYFLLNYNKIIVIPNPAPPLKIEE